MSLSESVDSVEAFLNDIAPYFHRRPVTYVDVGAYTGSVFTKVIASALTVREAHLIEPNPASIEIAKQRTASHFKGKSLNFYNVALGERRERVKLAIARDMSKVVAHADASLLHDGDRVTTEVDCMTLDDLAEHITDRRISLLKIDVEGHEEHVLRGAHKLLQDHRIDIVYLEAGMNPDNTQQCYYRRIEDALTEFDYRVFRIYEQKHEWLTDSPLLRRVNMAFMSQTFADRNPFQLTRELLQAQQGLEESKNQFQIVSRRLAQLESEHSAVLGRLQSLEADKSLLGDQVGQLKQQLEVARAGLQIVEARAAQDAIDVSNRLSLADRRRKHTQDMLSAVFASIGDMHRRNLGIQTARNDLIDMRKSRLFRIASAVINRPPSVRGWIGMPGAVWHAAVAPGDSTSYGLDAFTFDDENQTVTLALSVKPQTVVFPASPTPYVVWIQTLLADPTSPPTLEVRRRTADPAGSVGTIEGIEGQTLSDRGYTLRLQPGAPSRFYRSPADGRELQLEMRRARGDLCLIRLELRPPEQLLDQPQHEIEGPNGIRQFPSSELELKLWGGYATDALAALEERKQMQNLGVTAREGAAWSLVRWYFVEGDYERVLENVALTKTMTSKPQRRVAIAEAQSLWFLKRHEEAQACLERAIKANPNHEMDFRLFGSTVARDLALSRGVPPLEADQIQLNALNFLNLRAGIAPLAKRDPSLPLTLSNLVADAKPKLLDQSRMVSIVIPAYNAAESIGWVLDSLLRQTWRNLEIIVVDDLSTDDTCERVEAIAAKDARVHLIRKQVNEGAYATRNRGASAATGHFITIHDSDDWSHPQKIEMLIEILDTTPGKTASISHWTRVDEGLEVVGPWITRGSLIDLNFSSLLFERSVFLRMGAWDAVKVSGDAEYYYRLRALYGEECVVKLAPRYLLSLSLAREDSLTRSKATHLRSLFYGLRWNYRDAYLYWATHLTPDDPDPKVLDSKTGRRKFPMPLGLKPGKSAGPLQVGLVVIADFAESGEPAAAALRYMAAARKAGMRVAAFHWRKYERPARVSLQPGFYRTLMECDGELLSPGDQIEADGVAIFDVSILNHRIDPVPSIATQKVYAIVDELTLYHGTPSGDANLEPKAANASVLSVFGVEPSWVPMSETLRRDMRSDDSFGDVGEPWLPLADAGALAEQSPAWQGADGRKPVLGRYGSALVVDWPADVTALRQAYTVQGCVVRVAGDVSPVQALLGGALPDWQLLDVDALDSAAFLRSLDFYVHQTMPTASVYVTHGIVDAMAAGKPVILPPSYEEVFGNAAAYANPDQVADAVRRLWDSGDAYLALAQRGREFAARNCAPSVLKQRLRALETLATAEQAEPQPS